MAAEPPAAEPSAFEPAAAVSDAFTVRAPPTVNARPEGSVALADPLAIVTADCRGDRNRAAGVEADGVELEPEPEPPLADERLPAFVRSPATWPSTPPDGAELEVPFAEAVPIRSSRSRPSP